MALYQDINYLGKATDSAFHTEHPPGSRTPYSGIYRCWGCGREVASIESQPLPPQNHHQHNPDEGAIRWRMIVYANHRRQ